MELVGLFVSLGFLIACSGQEINEASYQTVNAETSTASENYPWGITSTAQQGTPMDARIETNPTTARTTTQDYSTIFTNSGSPRLMSMQGSPFGARIQHRKQSRREPKDRQSARKPEVMENLTENYSDPFALSQQYPDTQYLPYPPMMYSPTHMQSDGFENFPRPLPNNNADLYEMFEKQNASASTELPLYYGVPNGRFNAAMERMPYPFMNLNPYNTFLNNPYLVPNPENGLPRARPFMVPQPGFYPPPARILARDNGPQFYPEADHFARPPYGDRERGPAVVSLPRQRPEPTAESVESIAPRLLPEPIVRPELPSYESFPLNYAPSVLPPSIPVPTRAFPSPAVVPEFLPPAPEPLPVAPRRENEPLFPNPVLSKPEDVPELSEVPESRTSMIDESGVVLPPEERTNSLNPQEGHIPYRFGYDMNDGRGSDQHREETADENGVITGSYGFKLPGDIYRVVTYIADNNGFRAFIKSNEPGVANPGSADVVVMAEPPPPSAIVESLRRSGIGAVELPNEPRELVPVVPE